MYDLAQILMRAPAALRLVELLDRVRRGDPEALRQIRDDRVLEDLEAVSPQVARLVRAAQAAAKAFAETARGPQVHVVEAEFYEPAPPWDGFVRRLKEARWGGHVILGYPGAGKTTLALKLAWLAFTLHGWEVDCVELGDEELPPWARKIDTATLMHRAAKLRQVLQAGAVPDPDEDREPPRPPAGGLPRGRVIVVDEAGLAIPQGRHTLVRDAIRELLVRCRHSEWVVIFCAQTALLIPVDILGLCTVWVKCPPGARTADEIRSQLEKQARTDRENPYVRDLWLRAAEVLAGLPGSGWLVGPYRDLRAWAYVESPVLGYTGPVCFRRWQDDYPGEEVK